MEDSSESVRSFIKNYMTEKLSCSGDLESLFHPLPEKVEILSRHGGLDLMKSLDAEEVYNYSMLILDIAKLSLGVKEGLDESEIEQQVRYPVARTALDDQLMDIVREDAPERSETLPAVPMELEDWRTWESRIEEALPRTENDTQELTEIDHPMSIPHSTPLAQDVERILQGQSTPLRAESFPMPQTIADQGSTRFSTIPRQRPGPSRPLPAIRDDQHESNSVTSDTETVIFNVRDFARRSLERMEQRRLFDIPLQVAEIPDFPRDRGISEEIQQTFLERRSERVERRKEQRKHIFPIVPPKLRPLPRLTMTVAQRVQSHDDYLQLQTTTANRIQHFLIVARKEADIPENIQYTLPESIDEIRGGDSQSDVVSLHDQLLQDQHSADSNLIPIVPIISEIHSECADLASVHLPDPEPIFVPEYVERLIDPNPIRENFDLRPRNDIEEGYYSGQSSEPRRRRRQRRPNLNEVEHAPVQFEDEVIPLPMEPIPGISTEMTSPLAQQLTPSLDLQMPREEELFHEVESSDYFKNKFRVWREAQREKVSATTSAHMNPLAEVKSMEHLCKETQNVLSTLATKSYIGIDSVIPSNSNRVSASQRIAILLELKTRSIIELKRDVTSTVVGVENLAFNNPALNIPATSQMSRGAKESGFSEAVSQFGGERTTGATYDDLSSTYE